jgi:hypothetical protein
MTHGIVDGKQNHKSFALSSNFVDLHEVSGSCAFPASTHRYDCSYQNAQFFEDDRQVQGESIKSSLSMDTSYLLKELCIVIVEWRHACLHGENVVYMITREASQKISFSTFSLSHLRDFPGIPPEHSLISEKQESTFGCAQRIDQLRGVDEPPPKTVACYESIRRA